MRDGLLHNDDVAQLVAASNVALPRELVVPYLLREPAAPLAAARRADTAYQALVATVQPLGTPLFMAPVGVPALAHAQRSRTQGPSVRRAGRRQRRVWLERA